MGSTQILGPVPARSLDPVLLVQSQPPEMRGYVVLSSRVGTDTSSCSTRRAWDAIFLAGNPEPDCLRLTETSRALVSYAGIKHEIQELPREDRLVYLFEASEKTLREFLSIAGADPVLKVTLDSLDLRQIEALIAGTPVRNGLLERSEFAGDLPRFELARVSTVGGDPGSPFALPQLQLGCERGGLALYDLDHAPQHPPLSAEPGRGILDRRPSPRRVEPPMDTTLLPEVVREERLDAAESLMRIIDSVLTGPGPDGPGRDSKEDCAGPDRDPIPAGARTSTLPLPDPPPVQAMPPCSSIVLNVEPDPVLVMFQRLFRSFRKKGVESLGGRWEDALRSAVESVRFLTPEFQADALTPLTAPHILDLIHELIASAPILKRSRLRGAALLLIADIYDRHYDLLETRGLVDRVEQAYLRLKK